MARGTVGTSAEAGETGPNPTLQAYVQDRLSAHGSRVARAARASGAGRSVFARTDDLFLGVLESRFHKLWASETHNPLENRPHYRIGHSFESFPFPNGMAPNRSLNEVMANPLAVVIANQARALYAARKAALTSGSSRLDMTELYDLRDRGGATWLITAHRQLDVAVAAAYGWSPDLTDNEILAVLGELHQRRHGETLGNEDENT